LIVNFNGYFSVSWPKRGCDNLIYFLWKQMELIQIVKQLTSKPKSQTKDEKSDSYYLLRNENDVY
jgi:hypothetical protein